MLYQLKLLMQMSIYLHLIYLKHTVNLPFLELFHLSLNYLILRQFMKRNQSSTNPTIDHSVLWELYAWADLWQIWNNLFEIPLWLPESYKKATDQGKEYGGLFLFLKRKIKHLAPEICLCPCRLFKTYLHSVGFI